MVKHLILWTLLFCALFGRFLTREIFCCQGDHWLYHNTSSPCNQLNQGASSGYKLMKKWADQQYSSIDVVDVFNKSLLNFMISEQLWAEAEKEKGIDIEIFWMGMKLDHDNKELLGSSELSDGDSLLSNFFLNRLMNRKASDQICVDAKRFFNATLIYSKACWDAYMAVLHTKPPSCTNEWTTWSDCVDGKRTRERECAVIEPGCIVYPETVMTKCPKLDLIFPENGTILTIAGERLRIKFISQSNSSVLFRLINGPQYAVLTTEGIFEWNVPNDALVNDNYYLRVLLYNSDGHQRTIKLTLNIIKCPCIAPYGICTQPLNKNQGLGMYTCECQVGRFGTVCENDVNECESSPCHPLVDCINLHNMYWCTGCPDGYYGDGIICSVRQSEDIESKGQISNISKPHVNESSTCRTGEAVNFNSMPIQLIITISVFWGWMILVL